MSNYPGPQFTVSNLDFYYGSHKALKGINLIVPNKRVMAFIGPSGCGKTTLLRTLNRMNETVPERGSREASGWATRTYSVFLRRDCVGQWAWCSKNHLRFRRQFLTMWRAGLRLDPTIRRSEIADKVEKSLRRNRSLG